MKILNLSNPIRIHQLINRCGHNQPFRKKCFCKTTIMGAVYIEFYEYPICQSRINTGIIKIKRK